MVKHQSYIDADRNMAEYKMRTPYATPTPINRLTQNKENNHSPRRHVAHERSHSRHNLPLPFYHSEGRIEKNLRKKTIYQQQNEDNLNNYDHEKLSTTTTTITKQKSSCCTIL